ncbi:MAG TPA: hypothetical protein VFZ38_19360 [Vicinamibacterales bacterium]
MKKRRRVKRNPVPVYVSPGALQFITQAKKGAATVGDVIELDNGALARISSVDARARRIQATPLDGLDARGLDRARNAFRAFSGMEPADLLEVKAEPVPKLAWLLGEMEEVLYNTRRDGKAERYLHPFKKSARPLLAVDAKTGRLFLVGGDYTVTERGITDH